MSTICPPDHYIHALPPSGFSGLPTALRLLQRKASLTQCNCSSRVFVSSFQKGVLFLQKFVKEAPIINWTRLKNGQVCTKIFSTESRDQFVKPFFWEKKSKFNFWCRICNCIQISNTKGSKITINHSVFNSELYVYNWFFFHNPFPLILTRKSISEWLHYSSTWCRN